MNHATARVKRDLMEIFADKTPMIDCAPHESDLMTVHALIEGPEDTPYEGGFFYFTLRFPDDYPASPPKVDFKTTGSSGVRFNPNLYACGTVCLSILNTWPGPSWTPAMSLKSVLLSIQSLMNKDPFFNEPGYEMAKKAGQISDHLARQSQSYNQNIEHETFRVAVLGMLEDGPDCKDMPQSLKDVMLERFKANFMKYLSLFNKLKAPRFMRATFSAARTATPDSSLARMKERLMGLKDKFGLVDESDKKIEEWIASYENPGASNAEEAAQMDEGPTEAAGGDTNDVEDGVEAVYSSLSSQSESENDDKDN